MSDERRSRRTRCAPSSRDRWSRTALVGQTAVLGLTILGVVGTLAGKLTGPTSWPSAARSRPSSAPWRGVRRRPVVNVRAHAHPLADPAPFDPPDLPVAWSALGATARKALARLWQHGDQPGSAAGAELLAAHLVSGVRGPIRWSSAATSSPRGHSAPACCREHPHRLVDLAL